MVLYGCRQTSTNEGPPVSDTIPDSVDLQTWSVDSVRSSKQSNVLQLTGVVRYNPEHVYRFVPLLSGVVRNAYVSFGDLVKKGDVLLEISSPEITELSADLRDAKESLKVAKRQLQSQQSLYADRVASDREVLEAQTAVRRTQTAIEKLEENLRTYGGSIENGLLVVRAEIAGSVIEMNAVRGQQVEPGGEHLFALGNLNEVWIEANIYAGEIKRVQKGLKAKIQTTAWPDEIFHGKIQRLSDVIDPQEKVLKAVIPLPNPQSKLKPGMAVSIELASEPANDVVALPLTAVIFDQDRYQVLLADNPSQKEIRTITPLYQDDEFVYIELQDLQPGQKLIRNNALLHYQHLIEE